MKAIYKFNFDCGRMGYLSGVFVEEEDKVKELIESGREVCFGEVLGKHSDIAGPIESQDITLVTNDANVVELFEKHDLSSGYNPFDYIEEEEEENV